MARFNAAETLLAEQLRAAGIPFEQHYRYVPGRKFEADFAMQDDLNFATDFKHLTLLVEITGGVYTRQAHGSVTGVLKDNERLNLATLHGFRMLRFTPDEVNDGRALALIKEVLT